MAIQKKETKKAAFNIEIKRVKDLGNGTIMFDMDVNGVMIYGCSYKTLKRSDNGEEFAKVGFPSRKGKDDKWYNDAYFKIGDEEMQAIEKGIESLL